ncbi:MAG: TatD family hydrolase [Parcubacteria group bacterium]|nr:TatD family hydrolase [Parcubacteria group bacterium]
MFDTHCHINFKAYEKDADEVIKRTLDSGVWMILVGTQYQTSLKAVEMAGRYGEGVYAAVGIHPIHLMEQTVTEEEDTFHTKGEILDREKYFQLIKSSDKIVAIGEIGLDYYWIKTLWDDEQIREKEKQRKTFIEEFRLAQEADKPIIIHCRDAHEDMISLLETLIAKPADKLYGVVHSFTGNARQALRYADLGFMLGFNGIITYSDSYNKAIAAIPKDRIVVETDAPYLTPNPLPRRSRNEPVNVRYAAQKIARVLGLSEDEAADLTTANAKRLFLE